MIYLIPLLIIIILIFTNAVTDSSNVITTVVSTRVISFKKATLYSSIFCFLGIFTMCYLNFSVANCMSNIIHFSGGRLGIIMLASSMISVILVSLGALYFGIPTSETHGLIAGITGAGIAIAGLQTINFEEWKTVILGIICSVLGTYLLAVFITKILKGILKPIDTNKIKKFQLISCLGMSFMYGAQEGQKFVGILIIYLSIILNIEILPNSDPNEYFWIILFVALIMAMGVKIGGRRIVNNLGNNMIKLDNKEGLLSDITTVITIFVATILGLPISTTHVKTMSMIGIGKSNNIKINKEVSKNIFMVWIYTFPLCGVISYCLVKLSLVIVN